MPALESFLVRIEDGTVRTVTAHSIKGAARSFITTYAVEPGMRFWVKRRGENGWTGFTRTKLGTRQLND